MITGSIFTYATLYARPTYLQAISTCNMHMHICAGVGVATMAMLTMAIRTTVIPTVAGDQRGYGGRGPLGVARKPSDRAATDGASLRTGRRWSQQRPGGSGDGSLTLTLAHALTHALILTHPLTHPLTHVLTPSPSPSPSP